MKKRYGAEQIVAKLRQTDVGLGVGMKALEKENAHLKKLVTDRTLDIQTLKEAARPD